MVAHIPLFPLFFFVSGKPNVLGPLMNFDELVVHRLLRRAAATPTLNSDNLVVLLAQIEAV